MEYKGTGKELVCVQNDDRGRFQLAVQENSTYLQTRVLEQKSKDFCTHKDHLIFDAALEVAAATTIFLLSVLSMIFNLGDLGFVTPFDDLFTLTFQKLETKAKHI
ncbi:hypothetical protein Tco_0131573, partial [Tanacetum coccineum]